MKEHPLHLFAYCPVCGSAGFGEDGPTSKRCARCGFVYYFNPKAATAAFVLNEQGELLVARRAKEPAKGTLDLPGGFMERGETAEEGVAREVMEETGLQVESPRYLFSHPNVYPFSRLHVHTIDLFFLCRVPSRPVLRPHDDVDALQWQPVGQVQPALFGLRSIREGVERFINEKMYKTE